jgi:superfamily II DNA/RNA helicase
MPIQEQHYVMKNFRSGAFNLLVATSVAEEGYGREACHARTFCIEGVCPYWLLPYLPK